MLPLRGTNITNINTKYAIDNLLRAKISKQPDFPAIATISINTVQASPLTVRAEKSYYIIRV